MSSQNGIEIEETSIIQEPQSILHRNWCDPASMRWIRYIQSDGGKRCGFTVETAAGLSEMEKLRGVDPPQKVDAIFEDEDTGRYREDGEWHLEPTLLDIE